MKKRKSDLYTAMEREVHRLDQLMRAESQRVTEIMNLRAAYDEKLLLAEAKRIDAIRSVDVSAVSAATATCWPSSWPSACC